MDSKVFLFAFMALFLVLADAYTGGPTFPSPTTSSPTAPPSIITSAIPEKTTENSSNQPDVSTTENSSNQPDVSTTESSPKPTSEGPQPTGNPTGSTSEEPQPTGTNSGATSEESQPTGTNTDATSEESQSTGNSTGATSEEPQSTGANTGTTPEQTQPTTYPTIKPTTMKPVTPTPSTKLSGGSIAGIVIGVLAASAIIVGIAVALYKKKLQQRQGDRTQLLESSP